MPGILYNRSSTLVLTSGAAALPEAKAATSAIWSKLSNSFRKSTARSALGFRMVTGLGFRASCPEARKPSALKAPGCDVKFLVFQNQTVRNGLGQKLQPQPEAGVSQLTLGEYIAAKLLEAPELEFPRRAGLRKFGQ